MHPKAIIFDFDGTLVRSHADVYAAIDRLTRRHRQGPMPSPEQLREIETTELLRTLGIKSWQIPWFVWRARRELAANVDALEFEPGAPELLRAAAARGFKLGLVSSNSRGNVMRTLTRHDLCHLFAEFELGSSLHGKSARFTRLARRLEVEAEAVLCVGDEVRDIEAAAAIGMRSAAVAWGFHSATRLKRVKPDALIHTVPELGALLGLGPVPELPPQCTRDACR